MSSLIPHPRTTRSLEEMAAQKIIDALEISQTPQLDFASFGPTQQLLVFKYMMSTISRLRCTLNSIPPLDMVIHDPRADISDEPIRDMDKKLRDSFSEHWHCARIEGSAVTRRYHTFAHSTKWNEICVVARSEGAQFELLQKKRAKWGKKRAITSKYVYLKDRISSQLLYYRLALTFGMPARSMGSTDTNIWTVNLMHDDGSYLEFADSMGSIELQFEGTTDASESALELINFVAGLSCRDGTGEFAGGRRDRCSNS